MDWAPIPCGCQKPSPLRVVGHQLSGESGKRMKTADSGCRCPVIMSFTVPSGLSCARDSDSVPPLLPPSKVHPLLRMMCYARTTRQKARPVKKLCYLTGEYGPCYMQLANSLMQAYHHISFGCSRICCCAAESLQSVAKGLYHRHTQSRPRLQALLRIRRGASYY